MKSRSRRRCRSPLAPPRCLIWAAPTSAGGRSWMPHRDLLRVHTARDRCRTADCERRNHAIQSGRISTGETVPEAADPGPGHGTRGPCKVLRIRCSDLDANAARHALFCRWVEQTLMITRVLGTCENAMRIQIAVALIAFPHAARQRPCRVSWHRQPARLRSLICVNLMHRRPVDCVLGTPTPVPKHRRQITMELAHG